MEISIRLFREKEGGRVVQADAKALETVKGVTRVKQEVFLKSVDGGYTKDTRLESLKMFLQSQITVDGQDAGGRFPVYEDELDKAPSMNFSDLAHLMAAKFLVENNMPASLIDDLTINFYVEFK